MRFHERQADKFVPHGFQGGQSLVGYFRFAFKHLAPYLGGVSGYFPEQGVSTPIQPYGSLRPFPDLSQGRTVPDRVDSGIQPGSAQTQSPAVRSMPSAVEQIKNFLPPDQQARLEQAAFVFQALQQFT